MTRNKLLVHLQQSAARQARASIDTIEWVTLGDVTAIAERISGDVNVDTLDEAVREGIVESADFTTPSTLSPTDFFFGVDVAPAHVAAHLDVVRPAEIAEILAGLELRRHVVITGPSGSGKSALLWRAARTMEHGPTIWRIRRSATAEDVALLARHFKRLQPDPAAPVLVCADDLGHAQNAQWPDALRQLVDIPGVLILSAVRQEDLSPEISADGVIVDSHMSPETASEVYEAILACGIRAELAREEAVALADGLLMEFISLVTQGSRLKAVLARQVHTLERSDRARDRQALILVCAAHSLGFSMPADVLPAALAADPLEVGDSLKRLAGEHLILRSGDQWRGLHDLRTETLLQILHESAPPLLRETYRKVLPLLPPNAAPFAARRAAGRLAGSLLLKCEEAPADERLDRLTSELVPIAEALADAISTELDQASKGRLGASTRAVRLLEVAQRLDTIVSAYAAIPLLAAHRLPNMDLCEYAFLVRASKHGLLDIDHVTFRAIARVAGRLPDHHEDLARVVAAGVAARQVVEAALNSSLPEAAQLCESSEGLFRLSPQEATRLQEKHGRVLLDDGALLSVAQSEWRARLTASLTVLAELDAHDVECVLGSIEVRLTDAVSSDPFGCSARLVLEETTITKDPASRLVRTKTYEVDRLLVAKVVLFARDPDAAVETTYVANPDVDPSSLGAQAVRAVRLVMDACPEVDRVDVEVWQANLKPSTNPGMTDGVKSIRAGVLPRASATLRNVAFDASLAEALAVDQWTPRLSAQARIAQRMCTLLEEIPERLKSHDSAGRRRRWNERAKDLELAIAELPPRPSRESELPTDEQGKTLPMSAVEERLRERDKARRALSEVAAALLQVTEGFVDKGRLDHAGFLLAHAPKALMEARNQGSPIYASIGDTLPLELDEMCRDASRLLCALGDGDLARGVQADLDHGRDWRPTVATHSAAIAERDSGTLAQILSAGGVAVTALPAVRVSTDEHLPWLDNCVVGLVDLAEWDRAVAVLRGWDLSTRQSQGVSCRISVLPQIETMAIPQAITVGVGFETALIATDAQVEEIFTAFGWPPACDKYRAAVRAAVAVMLEFSSWVVRSNTRCWPGGGLIELDLPAVERIVKECIDPGNSLDEVMASWVGECAESVTQLAELVAIENGATPGLAARLAGMSVRDLGTWNGGEYREPLERAGTSALVADGLQTWSGHIDTA